MVNVPWCHDCDEPEGLCKCLPPTPPQKEAGELVERLRDGIDKLSVPQPFFDSELVVMLFEEAASSLTSLQARVEELERDLKAESDHRQRLQGALMFWMPGVRPETDEGLERSAGDDAYLLAGFNGPDPETCWGDDTLARLQEAEKALEEISSPSQTPNLLWWQIRAREALAAIKGEA